MRELTLPSGILSAMRVAAESGPHPAIMLDGPYLVATDRQVCLIHRTDMSDDAPVLLPLDCPERITVMNGVVMSDTGFVSAPAGIFFYLTCRSRCVTFKALLTNRELGVFKTLRGIYE